MTELRKRTQEMYRRAVRQLAEHYRKSPGPFSARENGRLCPKPGKNHPFGQNKLAPAVKEQKITACTEKLAETVCARRSNRPEC